MAHPMPLSARDTLEFRPRSAAVIAAREALGVLEADVLGRTKEGAPVSEEDQAALVEAQAALEAAEAARAEDDPVFLLKVPTGRTKALVNHAIYADADAPKFQGNKELIAAVEAEADEAGLSAEDVAALARAKELIAAGADMPQELWSLIHAAAQQTDAGRMIIADRILFSELLARHRIRYHLALPGKKLPLSERDVDTVEPAYLGAINAELVRLSELTKADAKNSAAP